MIAVIKNGIESDWSPTPRSNPDIFFTIKEPIRPIAAYF
jgi:hypothetical protein